MERFWRGAYHDPGRCDAIDRPYQESRTIRKAPMHQMVSHIELGEIALKGKKSNR